MNKAEIARGFMRLFILLTLFISTLVNAQVVGDRNTGFTSVSGADYFTNYILNPSAKKNVTSISTSSAAVARSTTAGYKIDGVSSIECDASALNGYCEFTLDTIRNPADEGNCEFKGLVKGDGTLYAAQVLDGSSNVLATSSVLGNRTTWTPFSVNYVCSSSRKVRITQTVAGTAPAIYLGKLYYGQATNIGSGIAPNTFSAKVSLAGVVSDETGGDWINGNCSLSDTSLFACTFSTGFFTATPTCTFSLLNNGDAAASAISISTTVAANSTSITYRTSFNATKSAVAVGITCTKTGSDYSQNTITANNYNYDWTAAGLSTTQQGFGTVTYTNAMDCRHKRDGGDLLMDCRFTAGTTTASQARFTLPTGLTIDSVKVPAGSVAGRWYRNNASATTTKSGAMLINIASSDSHVYFTGDEYTPAIGPFNATNGSTLFGTGEVVFFEARIPISGWSETQNAPQLLGSVTSNASGALKFEAAYLNCDGSSSITSQSSSSFISTIGNIASGACAVTFSSSYSAAPWCIVVGTDLTNPSNIYSINSTTVSSISIDCDAAATGTDCTAYDVNLMCLGAR